MPASASWLSCYGFLSAEIFGSIGLSNSTGGRLGRETHYGEPSGPRAGEGGGRAGHRAGGSAAQASAGTPSRNRGRRGTANPHTPPADGRCLRTAPQYSADAGASGAPPPTGGYEDDRRAATAPV